MVAEAQRFNVAVCGRQMGKTTLGVERVARGASDGMACAWFAPTYKYLDQVWRSLRDLLGPVTVAKSEQQHRIEVSGGGTVDCWSLDDPDAGRGRRYERIVIDEAAMVRDLERVWQASLRPTLSVLGGDAWFLSTPKGLNYFHRLFQLGMDPLESEWMAWQLPSSTSPYIRSEEIEAARRITPERVFAQEYLAQFLEIEGAGVFSGVGAVSRLQPRGPQQGHSYAFGVDWAAGGADWTVISGLDVGTREQVFIDRFTTADFDVSVGRLHALERIYKPIATLAEQNSIGMPLIQRLQRGWTTALGDQFPAIAIQPWVSTNASKAAAVEQLAIHIENGEITLLDDPVQKGELMAFESKVLPSGLIRYSAPEGGHDDTVISLMLANRASQQETGLVRAKYSFNPKSPEFKRAEWSFRR